MFYHDKSPLWLIALVDYLMVVTKNSSFINPFFRIANKEKYEWVLLVSFHTDTMSKKTLPCTFCCSFSFLGHIQFSLNIFCKVEFRPCDKRIICFIYTLE